MDCNLGKLWHVGKLNHRGFYSVFKADITAAERLALTLRYLATGNSQVSTKFRFELL